MEEIRQAFIAALKMKLEELDDEIPWILTNENGDWDKIADDLFSKFDIKIKITN